ncbi:hypothetical protein BDY21DRAFT_353565 [Lineolata rhizophorae]|uniref:Uncharacterized protein n=1 Tax=Lineolata rhizophorae TaxID=578093 RepID=A0A6A6NS94_9PEZI|nr:hypothetical protein BDY21DRAFT_353565 [Lineolata rhizophorae]
MPRIHLPVREKRTGVRRWRVVLLRGCVKSRVLWPIERLRPAPSPHTPRPVPEHFDDLDRKGAN